MIGRAMTGAKTPMKSTAEPIIPRMSFLFIAISSPSKIYHLIIYILNVTNSKKVYYRLDNVLSIINIFVPKGEGACWGKS